ncbi:MAG TPA: adenylate/guanylate cyclase domain-containing protein [Gemmatimonadaceae bacterium]|nr:adenylate/guanylate cyclase domain-containing protein [Gemmatimonadaceae bacterium]
MALRLTSSDGELEFDLRAGVPLVLGRAMASDLPVIDPTVSRRHASLLADDDGVDVRDLDSSNGTFVNGERVGHARAAVGDLVGFGQTQFALHRVENGDADGATGQARARNMPTIVRQRAVPDASEALAAALRESEGASGAVDEALPTEHARVRQRLSLLLEVSKSLTRALDIEALLDRIADVVFRILDVDRLSILLLDEHGDLVPRLSRDREGSLLGRTVPLSIARTAIEERVAILSDNASDDARFEGHSMAMQQVRSAVCAPLMGSDGGAIGVLYVDMLTAAHSFSDEDLDFVVAFSGIAAVAIENSRFAERSRQETLIRSNFERYFTPAMASRIAAAPGAIRLGGERRDVAVLFSDIRGFTEIAGRMNPDDTARLLTEYFTEMVECVFRHGGTLDKFMGDAVMAQWGAPLGESDDADRALDAACDMMLALDGLNDRWRAAGQPELQIGIGLNYGEVFAGNIGSERRLEFTVIGDTVNTASRLCAWADGGEILVSERFRTALTRAHPLQPRPPLRLRGRTEPVTVYRVVL